MENRTAKTCKAIAIVSEIVMFIFGIVLGKVLGDIFFDKFSWTIFLIIASSNTLFSVAMYALAEIIENLYQTNKNTRKTYEILRDIHEGGYRKPNQEVRSGASTPSAPIQPVVESVPHANSWTCKKCGTRNSNNNRYCRDCGQYK
jgi:hypothetical protein